MSKSARIRRASVSQAQAPAAPEVTATVAASAPAAAPVDPVAAAPAATAAPAPNTVPAVLEALLSNVTSKQETINEAIVQIDNGKLRGYEDGLRASEYFGCSWEALAALRPTPFNSHTVDPSEAAFRDALNRADPFTSPVFTEETSNAIKLAVTASNKDTYAAVKAQFKNTPTHKGHTGPEAVAAARATLDALLAEYSKSNNGLMRDKVQECIDAIDDTPKLTKVQKALASTRTKGTNRRAVLSMLNLVRPIIDAKTKEEDRGDYTTWACKAKTFYEDYIVNATKADTPTVITADTVKDAVTNKLTSYFELEYGDRLKEQGELKELSKADWIDRLYDLIAKCAGKKEVITKETAIALRDVLVAKGHLRSDASDPASLNEGKAQDGTGSNVTSKRTRGAAAGTVSNPEQPVMQPTQQAVAPVQVADAAKPVAARGRVRGTPTQQATPPVGPSADAAAAVLNA